MQTCPAKTVEAGVTGQHSRRRRRLSTVLSESYSSVDWVYECNPQRIRKVAGAKILSCGPNRGVTSRPDPLLYLLGRISMEVMGYFIMLSPRTGHILYWSMVLLGGYRCSKIQFAVQGSPCVARTVSQMVLTYLRKCKMAILLSFTALTRAQKR